MSSDLNEQTITEAVQRTFDTSTDQRFRQVLVCLVQHLHDFAREVQLTGEEWFTAMDFLERVGKISSPTRQEVMLLSDILGFSMLLDRINQHSGSSVTASALLGPFYVEGRPTANNGDDISDGVAGTPMFVTGRVVDEQGKAIAGAHVDTWHSDGEGFYDVQQTEKLHDEFAMRALLTTDDDGRFWYRSITPRYYPTPTDGPCGRNHACRKPIRHAPAACALLVPRRRLPTADHPTVLARRSVHRPRRGLRGCGIAAGGLRASRARGCPRRDDGRRALRDSGLDLHPRRPTRRKVEGAKPMSRIPLATVDQQPEEIRQWMARRGNLNVFRIARQRPPCIRRVDADGRRAVRQPYL